MTLRSSEIAYENQYFVPKKHSHTYPFMAQPSALYTLPCSIQDWVPFRDFPELCVLISVLFFSWAFLILVEIFFHYSFVVVVTIDCQLCKT